jgi:hypothetical protein
LEDLQVQLAVILQQQEQVYKELTEVRSLAVGREDRHVLTSKCNVRVLISYTLIWAAVLHVVVRTGSRQFWQGPVLLF